jgi:hypothetical protein
MSRIYNKYTDDAIRSVEPTSGFKKTKEYKKKLEIKNRNKNSKDTFNVVKGKQNLAKGGRAGLKFGSKKSNVQKIQEAFAPKKQLSAKQMKIAKQAGNPKKIEGVDFKKLRGRA